MYASVCGEEAGYFEDLECNLTDFNEFNSINYNVVLVGPMARSVQHAAILIGLISDIDLRGCDVDISACFPDKNFTLGVLRDQFWNISDSHIAKTLPHLEACLNDLNASGLVRVIDPVTSPTPIPDIKDENGIPNFRKGRIWLIGNISTLADVIRYNELYPMHYNQSLLKLAERTDGLQNRTYMNVKHEHHRKSTEFLESIFRKYAVDALATPCHADEALDLYTYGAYAGYPSITVPVGVDDIGLPFGLCLLGQMNSEPLLLKLGYFVEISRSKKRPTPHFVRECQ